MTTHIYWLIDIRPETLAAGWSSGRPFYCGKTVFRPERRLARHVARAHLTPDRPVHKWVTACDGHIKVHVVEIVPLGENWRARERYWIRILRLHFPDTANVADGGEGHYTVSKATRARISRTLKRRLRFDPDTFFQKRAEMYRRREKRRRATIRKKFLATKHPA